MTIPIILIPINSIRILNTISLISIGNRTRTSANASTTTIITIKTDNTSIDTSTITSIAISIITSSITNAILMVLLIVLLLIVLVLILLLVLLLLVFLIFC